LVSLLFQQEIGIYMPPSIGRALHELKSQIKRMLLGALRVSFITLRSASQCHAVFSVRLTSWYQWTRSILTDITFSPLWYGCQNYVLEENSCMKSVWHVK
jgi:hypothetical protein